MSEAAGKDISTSLTGDEERPDIGAPLNSAPRTGAPDVETVSLGDVALAAQDEAPAEPLSAEGDVDAADLDAAIDHGLAVDDLAALDEELAIGAALSDDPSAEDDAAVALASADEVDSEIDAEAMPVPAAPASAPRDDVAVVAAAEPALAAGLADDTGAESELAQADVQVRRRATRPSILYRFDGEFQGCIAGAVAGRLQITAERGEESVADALAPSDGALAATDEIAEPGEPRQDGDETIATSSDEHAEDVEEGSDDADTAAEIVVDLEAEDAPRLSLFVNGHDLGPCVIAAADGSFLFSLLPHRELLGLDVDCDLDVSLVDARDGAVVLSSGEQKMRWTRYAAKLLNYQNETIVGFCFDTLDPDMPSFVSISVNGSQVAFGLANKVSRILQRYAPAPTASGFAVPVGVLQPGSVVTMQLPTSGITLETFLLIPGADTGPDVTHSFSAAPGLAIRGWRARTDGGWRDKASVSIAIDGCEPYTVEANQIEAAAYRAGGSIFGGFSIRLSPSMVVAGSGDVTLTDPEEGTVLWTTRLDEQEIFIGQLTQMLDYGPDEQGEDGNGLSLLFFYNLNRLMTSPAQARARKLLSRLALRALNRLVDTGGASFAANVLRTLPLELHLPEWRLSGVALFHKLARTLSAGQAESLRVAINGAHNAKCKTSAVFTGIDLVLQARHSGVKPHIARLLRWLQVMKFSSEAHSVVNEVVEAYARSPEEAHMLRRLVMFDMLANSLQPVAAA